MRAELDFFRLQQSYGEEERLIRDAVRTFVDARVLPIIQQHFRAGTFPRELVPEIAELGLLGATLDRYGGAGVSQLAYGLIMQELDRGDSAIRNFVSAQTSLVIHPIYAYGDEAQRARWLPGLIGGELIGCFGLTEPDFGSNPAGLRTTARREGNSFVLNGTKRWITNGSIADLALVFARGEDGRLGGYLVERGTPGFETREIEGKLSLRASPTGELLLDDCRVPADNRLPGAVGLKPILSTLNEARYGIAWGVVGAAKACFFEALDYARERVQFDRPIAGFQLVQHKLAEIYGELVEAELLCLRLAQLKQAGDLHHVTLSVAKRNNVAMALRTARAAREILGANGIVDDYCPMRHACNLESVATYEGTHDIHTLVIGQALTGLAAFTG